MSSANPKFHPIADIFPLMQTAELESLAQDIVANGLREKIWLYQGKVIDGRNRLLACRQAGVEPRFREWDGRGSLVSFVVSHNLIRRHLTSQQRAGCSIKALPHLEAEAAKRRKATEIKDGKPPTVTQKVESPSDNDRNENTAAAQAAELFQTNRQYVADMKTLSDEDPDAFKAVMSGDQKLADVKREKRRKKKKKELEAIAEREASEPTGLYDVIVVDPPWPMKKIERDERPNQSEFDYPTMTEGQLGDLSVPCADNCHVWLWTTQKFLPMAFRLLEVWKLNYICTFVWHKPGGFQPFNLPQYNCEFALYARKGSPEFLDTKAFPTCFEAPRGKHTEKPEHFYEVLRRVTAGRRLDMFNRRDIEGFDGYGKEVPV